MNARPAFHRTVLAGLISILMAGSGQAAQQTGSAATQEARALASDDDKLSYALGADFANQLRSYAVDVDLDLLIQGLRDARSGSKTLLTEAEIRAVVNELRQGLVKKQMALQNERLAKTKSEGEAFLAGNKTKPGVVTLESGLQYKVLKGGDGRKPALDDTVVAHFRGTNINGTEFANSYKTKRPATFAVNKVIKGWTEALQLMPVGSKWQLFIPSHLAYGERGVSRRVAPSAAVIFEVELIAIQDVKDRASAPTNTVKLAAAHEKTAPGTTALTAIRVSFRLDPQLTRGLQMGERWVSPPKYNAAQAAKSIKVDARAEGLDANGATKTIRPTWTPANPGMVTVTPGEGSAVAITVHRAGESTLRVASGEISKELAIKAEYLGQVIQVEIVQK